MKILQAILLVLTVQLSFGQEKIQKIDSLIKSLSAKGKFNGIILVAEKGKITYHKNNGLADESTKEVINENSIFNLASISKQFTAMGIMILMEKGKLQLDDPLTKYIPELSGYPIVTIKNLLNHTSGLPGYMKFLAPLVDRSKKITNDDVIKLYSQHSPDLMFQTGTQFKYCNTGYVFLASIIERVSGISYAEFLKKNIFEPLKMDRTFVYYGISTPEKTDNFAKGYVFDKDDKKYVEPHQIEKFNKVFGWMAIYGDGAVHATALDLLKWDRALYTNKLISDKSLNEMFSPTHRKGKLLKSYGYGFNVKNYKLTGKIIRHSGGWPGYVTEIERHIDTDKTIIVLQNHNDSKRPIRWIRNILYGASIPKTMNQLYGEGKSVDAIIKFCQDPDTEYLVDGFREYDINTFGYQLMKVKRNKDALKVFRLNTQLYPKSANTYDSLGECLMKLGKEYQEEGIDAYEKALELNPDNKNAKSIVATYKKSH